MGVQGLWKLIEPCGRMVPLESMSHKVLAVDVSIWLHQAMKGMHDAQGAPVAIAHLLVLFHRLCKLLFYKIKPVFVFDGGVPALKRSTMAVRRTQKNTARSEASRVRGKLLKNLLKHEALRHVLSDETASNVLGLTSLTLPGPNEEEDLYKLPPVAAQPSDSNSSDGAESSSEDDSDSPHADIHSLDLESSSFKALPAEVRHDILSEMQETRKQSSWRHLDEMPSQSQDFSDFQMNRLLKRRAVQVTLEATGKEMGARDVSLQELQGMLGDEFVGGTVQSGRIAQDGLTRFMLIQRPKASAAAGQIDNKVKESKNFDILEHIEDVQWSDASDTDELNDSKKISAAHEEFLKIQSLLEEGLTEKKDVDSSGSIIKNSEEEKREIKVDHADLSDSSEREKAKLVVKMSHTEPKTDKLAYAENATLHEIISIMDDSDASPNQSSLKQEVPVKRLEVPLFKHTDLKKPDEKILSLVREIKEELQSELIAETNNSEERVCNSVADSVRTRVESDLPPREEETTPTLPGTLLGDGQIKEMAIINKTAHNLQVIEALPTEDLIPNSEHSFSETNEGKVTEMVINTLIEEQMPSAAPKIFDVDAKSAQKSGDELSISIEDGSEDTRHLIASKTIDVKAPAEQTPSEFIENEHLSLNQIISEKAPPEIITVEKPLDLPISVEANEIGCRIAEEQSDSDDDFIPVLDTPPRYPSPPPTSTAITNIMKANVSPPTQEVVSDGVPRSEEELAEYQKSLERERDELLNERGRNERMAQNVTDQMYADAQELLKLFGVPYIVAPMEAEAQCAALELLGLTQGTITDDSDIWLFGGRSVYKNFFNQKQRVLEFRCEDIREYFKLSREDMIKLALLVGSDYTSGVQGIGPVTALEVLASFPSPSQSDNIIAGLQKFRDWVNSGFVVGPTRVALRSKVKNATLIPGFPSQAVVDAYLHPEVDNSEEPFSWSKPNVILLQKYTKLKFGWTTERCNELIMPIMKKLMEVTDQTTIDRFFKPASKPSHLEGRVSKRVEGALKRLGSDTPELEEEIQPKPSTSRAKRPKQEAGERKMDPVTLRLHQEVKIPQREWDKLKREDKRKKAADLLKSTRGRGRGRSRGAKVPTPSNDRKEVKLSESSSEED